MKANMKSEVLHFPEQEEVKNPTGKKHPDAWLA